MNHALRNCFKIQLKVDLWYSTYTLQARLGLTTISQVLTYFYVHEDYEKYFLKNDILFI